MKHGVGPRRAVVMKPLGRDGAEGGVLAQEGAVRMGRGWSSPRRLIGLGKEALKSDQSSSYGEDMTWTLRILKRAFLFSVGGIPLRGVTWEKRNRLKFPPPPFSQGRTCSLVRASGNPVYLRALSIIHCEVPHVLMGLQIHSSK